MSFFEFSERGCPQARRYFDQVSAETGREVRPRSVRLALPPGDRLLFLRRLSSRSCWIAVAGLRASSAGGSPRSRSSALSASSSGERRQRRLRHAGGADEANVDPRSQRWLRVILYGLVRLRSMALLSRPLQPGSASAWTRRDAWLGPSRVGIAGALVSVFYTAPPLRLVHRGLGELAVGSASGRSWCSGRTSSRRRNTPGALARVAARRILIALILYVNRYRIVSAIHAPASGRSRCGFRAERGSWLRPRRRCHLALIAAFAISGLIARPPSSRSLRCRLCSGRSALRDSYESPYALMPAMGKTRAPPRRRAPARRRLRDRDRPDAAFDERRPSLPNGTAEGRRTRDAQDRVSPSKAFLKRPGDPGRGSYPVEVR